MAGEYARRRRVLIVGGGFAGFHAAQVLSRLTIGLNVKFVLVARLTDRPPRTFAEMDQNLAAA